LPRYSGERVRKGLLENPIFALGTKASLDHLLTEARERIVGAKESILTEGQDAGELFVLIEGAVRVFHANSSGDEVTVKLFRAPAIFGEAESFSGIPYVENVCAIEPSRLLVFPIAAILGFLEKNAGAAVLMLRDVAHRLAIAAYDEKALAFYPVTVRLANHLLDQLEYSSAGSSSFVALTQEQMATAIGATRRSVAKDVIAWQAERILRKQGSGYVVEDLAALRRYADPLRLKLTHQIAPIRTK
jgi:CRP-like cAMP-binding protein